MKKQTGLEVIILSRLIGRYLNGICIDSDNKITGAQGMIICYLIDSQKDVFQKDIEKEFDIRRSTATGLLHSLEVNGLIQKEEVSYDARLKKIVLTEKAIDIKCQIDSKKEQLEKILLKDIKHEEMIAFNNTISKMTENLIKEAQHG